MRQRANVMRESGVRPATSSAGTTRHRLTDVPATGSSALSGEVTSWGVSANPVTSNALPH
jgi:hypothetical protein